MRKQEKSKYYGDGATCEICGIDVAPENLHSFILTYAMPGKYQHPEDGRAVGITAYQCLNQQHVGCCHAHAVEAAITCLLHHHDLYEVEGDMHPGIAGLKDALSVHIPADDNYSHRAKHEKKLAYLQQQYQQYQPTQGNTQRNNMPQSTNG